MPDIEDVALETYEYTRYILNSQQRLKILRILLEEDMTIPEIKKHMKGHDKNILRTLKELQEIGYVHSKEKKYILTSTGYLAIRNIMNILNNWQTINRYKDDFKHYSLKKLPIEYSRYIYLLQEAIKIESTSDDYYKTRNIYRQKISEARTLEIILPIYSHVYLDAIQETIRSNDATLELITSRNIYEEIRKSDYYQYFNKFRKRKLIRLWLTEEDVHDIFLTITDKFSAISFFYEDETYEDTTYFWDEKFKNKKMLENIFDSYKVKMKAKEIK